MTLTWEPRISAAVLIDSTVKPNISTRSRHATWAESSSSMTDDSSSLDAMLGNPIANEISPETLASVREAYNAVFVEATAAGELMFYGKGAGGDPTASAVMGDIVAVARHRVSGGRGPGESAYAQLPVHDIGKASTRYHISLAVADRPGVLAQVASVFAAHGVSIQAVRQQVVGGDGEEHAAQAYLIVVTHTAPDAALTATVEALSDLETVTDVVSVMRVEGS